MAVLKRGDKGSKVKQLQTLLGKAGAKPAVKPTGTFCPLTEQAVKDFQKKNKLKADGVAGKGTMEALEGGSEKPIKWTVKDAEKPRLALDKVIARYTKHDTYIDDTQRKLIGTKDKKINVLRQKYDIAGKAFYDKAFEVRDALYDVIRLKREFDWAKNNAERQKLMDEAKKKYAEAQKLNDAGGKLKDKFDAADFALNMELQSMMKAA